MNNLAPFATRALRFALPSLALVAAMTAPAPAIADGSEAKLTVTATVLKRASLKILTQPSAVTVTAADIARGYVDLPVPAQVAIESNSASGYMLDFAYQAGFARQILVQGLSSEVQLGPGGGAVLQPASGSGVTRTTLALGFRFVLSELAQQGVYSWPMQLSVTPL